MNSTGYRYRRHSLAVRVAHWINVVALVILFMSGLGIFNAHPALYWGTSSYAGNDPVLAIGAIEAGGDRVEGVTRIGEHDFDTTGVLGVSRDRAGELAERAFPWWLTIPDDLWLAMSRAWHFFFAWILLANGLFYVTHGLLTRHFARDVVPTRDELAGIGESIVHHVKFHRHRGEAAKRYNVLQQLAYLAIVFVVLPLAILTGLSMSPWLNAVGPDWVELLGGRQSARTIHFVCAWLIVAFAAIHVFQVIVTGLWNNLRSMLSGHFHVEHEPPRAP